MKGKIGKTQADVLDALRRHHLWYNGCGWLWSTPGETTRILDSLVRRGLVKVDEEKISQFYTRRTFTPADIDGDLTISRDPAITCTMTELEIHKAKCAAQAALRQLQHAQEVELAAAASGDTATFTAAHEKTAARGAEFLKATTAFLQAQATLLPPK